MHTELIGLSTRDIAGYGWKPDLPDRRDLLFTADPDVIQNLPATVDLTQQCPPVLDQSSIGSCTANAIASAVQFDQMKQNIQSFTPSRLFIYYNERVIEGSTGTDSGAQIRDGIKVVAKLGAPPETDWPYDIARFSEQPPQQVYTNAGLDRVVQYRRILRSLSQMQACLAAGYPFVFGFTVYESFESSQVAQTGVVNLPTAAENIVGGHAVKAVGYDNQSNRFKIKNSWGLAWGQNGYFTIPYAYLMDRGLASDFWSIRLVQEKVAA